MKKITSILILSTILLAGCSYLPKWLTNSPAVNDSNQLKSEQVKPKVVYYDTQKTQDGKKNTKEGVITNDLSAIFYKEGDTTAPPSGSLKLSDISNKIPSRKNINPGIAASLVPNNEIIHFDFDSSSMSPEVKAKIEFHINFLRKNPKIRVILEGHADERGSREYNLGLGELRALAVKDLMVLNGVSNKQIFVISYGEEKPINTASNEKAWAQNRRVEIIYK